ncbi:MAG: hypothetical protein F6K49_32305 [Moorea sp. SIO3I6]|nr:hypothetical protein [Moorena sp. SIO3I6]
MLRNLNRNRVKSSIGFCVGIVIIFDTIFPTPDSLLPTPYSLIPIPDSRLPTPDSLLPTP